MVEGTAGSHFDAVLERRARAARHHGQGPQVGGKTSLPAQGEVGRNPRDLAVRKAQAKMVTVQLPSGSRSEISTSAPRTTAS